MIEGPFVEFETLDDLDAMQESDFGPYDGFYCLEKTIIANWKQYKFYKDLDNAKDRIETHWDSLFRDAVKMRLIQLDFE